MAETSTAPLAYYVFDLLWTEGMDVTAERILERRRRLTEIVSEVPGVQVGGYVEGHGKELFPRGEGETDGGDCGQAQSDRMPKARTWGTSGSLWRRQPGQRTQ
jgi:ATP dependent DNA ligase domain